MEEIRSNNVASDEREKDHFARRKEEISSFKVEKGVGRSGVNPNNCSFKVVREEEMKGGSLIVEDSSSDSFEDVES